MLKDAFIILGGSNTEGITKRSFVIFINALNNLFLPWMSEKVKNDPFFLSNEKEVQKIHAKFFALWEHKSKLRISLQHYDRSLNNSTLLNDVLKQRDTNALVK
jgi:hypothetical protein